MENKERYHNAKRAFCTPRRTRTYDPRLLATDALPTELSGQKRESSNRISALIAARRVQVNATQSVRTYGDCSHTLTSVPTPLVAVHPSNTAYDKGEW